MKSLIVAASAVAMAAVAAPAFAQGAAPQVTGYANLGYSLVDTQGAPNLSAVQGRLGARIAQYFGVEGEAGFGVGSKRLSGVDVKVKSTVAAYAVGFLPVQPNFDVFARVGYGHDTVKATLAGVSASAGEDSVNYGGGAQYFFTAKDGLRAEYTRHDLRHNGGDANVWSISYVRKFP